MMNHLDRPTQSVPTLEVDPQAIFSRRLQNNDDIGYGATRWGIRRPPVSVSTVDNTYLPKKRPLTVFQQQQLAQAHSQVYQMYGDLPPQRTCHPNGCWKQWQIHSIPTIWLPVVLDLGVRYHLRGFSWRAGRGLVEWLDPGLEMDPVSNLNSCRWG